MIQLDLCSNARLWHIANAVASLSQLICVNRRQIGHCRVGESELRSGEKSTGPSTTVKSNQSMEKTFLVSSTVAIAEYLEDLSN
jgi:hypothetical protein